MRQLVKILSVSALVLIPAIYFGLPENNLQNCGANFDATHRQLINSLSAETKTRLFSERSVTEADICQMPLASLEKSLNRLVQPKPDHPGEAYAFRYMQQLSENKQLNVKNWQAARDFVNQAKLRQANGAGLNSTSWESIGPGNIGGRIRSLAFDPDNSDRIYVGSVSGGVWVTENAGASWQPTDDFMANLSVSTLKFDPNNSAVIYAGTGEGTFNSDNVRGLGIFKSVDKGVSWQGLSATQNVRDFYWVNRITMLNDSSKVIAATHTGIWTSLDAGESWTRQHVGRTNDVDVHPSDNNKLIAGAWGSAYYSVDAGATWTQSTGLADLGSERIEVAYARSNPDIVYASVEQNSGEVWKSVDGGQSYTLINTGTSYLGSQGWYDNALWVDPTNPDHIIVGGIDLYRSEDGGANLSRISIWWQAPNSPHADHHFILEHPDYNGVDNQRVYFANDGGVYFAEDISVASGTNGWQELNNELAITQFYGMGVAPDNTVVGGTQDNGTLVYKGDSEGWTDTFGGDGGFSAADPTDSNYLYGEYVYLQIHRSTNGGVSSSYIYGNGMDTDGANFIAPFILDPNEPNRMLGGARQLWVSDNVKDASPNWVSKKSAITGNSAISAIAVAPGDSNVIYVGHNDGSIFKTTNGLDASPVWTSIVTSVMPDRYVMRIAIDPINTDTLYVSFSGYEDNNLWKSTDAGVTFNLSVGTSPNQIPPAPIRSIAIHPTKNNQVYVGTEVGIFTSSDGGASWDFNNNGPANVSVDELVWSGTDTLYAATHGRGIFKADVNGDVPNSLNFTTQVDTARDATITSNTETITGITQEVDISVVAGEYSLGCDNSFTSAAGKANDGDTVCVRHTSSADYYQTTQTQLTVGASTFTFESRTEADTLPDDVIFTSLDNVELDSVNTSEIVTILGITNQVEISITQGEYSKGCQENNFTNVTGSIALGETVCVRQTASSEHNTSKTTTLTLGSLNVNFTTTTLPDTTPDEFSFNGQTDIAISTSITSNSIVLSGFEVAIPVSVTNGEYSIGCDPNSFTSQAGEVSPQDTICVRHTSSDNYVTQTTTTLDVNGVSGDFVSTTSPDRTPDDFAFTAVTGAELSTQITSNSVTINGVAEPVAISVSGGEFSIGCGATFTSVATNISNGQSVCLRHTSAATNSASVTTSLTVGTETRQFSSTTKAAPPSSSGGGGALSLLFLLVLAGSLGYKGVKQRIIFK
ncbi:hypothetical protein [Aliikangiella sp. IMCC44632]